MEMMTKSWLREYKHWCQNLHQTQRKISKEVEIMIYKKYIKRPLDITLSSAGLIVLSPVLIGLSLAIKQNQRAPFYSNKNALVKTRIPLIS